MTDLAIASNRVSRFVSLNGYEFDVRSDKWDLKKGCQLYVEFTTGFKKDIQDEIRQTLAYFAEHRSSGHASNVCRELKKYLGFGFNTISESGLLHFKARHSAKKDEYKVAILRVFLKQMYFLGFNSVTEQIYELINSWRLAGCEKGNPVLSLDPEYGPFSDIEFQSIIDGLDYHYGESKLSDECYSLAQVFAATGRRPIQIASLKIGDFRLDEELLEEPTYILRIPRAKIIRGKFRTAFKDFAITESLGQVLKLHISKVMSSAEFVLQRKLSEKEAHLLPLFPDKFEVLKGCTKAGVLALLSTDATHLSTNQLTKKLSRIIDSLKITSERTGRRLKITGYRFRYTLGTRAAREGAGVLTIANILDHVDHQNSKVYVANIPEHAAEISRVMNGSLVRYADAFKGKVVVPDQKQGMNSKNVIIRSYDNTNSMGECGTEATCHDHAPVACYTCPKFKAWKDAPHANILKWLQNERKRIAKSTGDLEISAINDRAIYAVTQVMRLCAQMGGS